MKVVRPFQARAQSQGARGGGGDEPGAISRVAAAVRMVEGVL
jgi:hypothetical protein